MGVIGEFSRTADSLQIVVTERCQGCGACLLTCPEHAIRPHGRPLLVLETCTGCGECIEVCPVDAIEER
jgi:Pyruvate/2-oxoacid:ferredoxin oxidoreductase delta subunit